MADQVKCPKCGSTQIQLMKRGWKLTTGLIGANKVERVCMNCKHKF
jgi:DNA-directed RNA polymerase subunit RPC12/RpoP